eukprot:COSAG06_NODE_26735_length_608_cov_1.005894_1_plen_202_part_11
MVPEGDSVKVKRSSTQVDEDESSTDLMEELWSPDALYIDAEKKRSATMPTLDEEQDPAARPAVRTQGYRLRHNYPMRKHAAGASWQQTYWPGYEVDPGHCKLCKTTKCEGLTAGWYYSPHCRSLKDLLEDDTEGYAAQEMPSVRSAEGMFDICPKCWKDGVKTRVYSQTTWKWLRNVQSKETWLRLPGQAKKTDREQPSHIR